MDPSLFWDFGDDGAMDSNAWKPKIKLITVKEIGPGAFDDDSEDEGGVAKPPSDFWATPNLGMGPESGIYGRATTSAGGQAAPSAAKATNDFKMWNIRAIQNNENYSAISAKQEMQKRMQGQDQPFFGPGHLQMDEEDATALRRLIHVSRCDLCEFGFSGIQDAKSHYTSERHNENIQRWLGGHTLVYDVPSPPKGPDEEPFYVCDTCGICLSSFHHYKRHEAGRKHCRMMGKRPPSLQPGIHDNKGRQVIAYKFDVNFFDDEFEYEDELDETNERPHEPPPRGQFVQPIGPKNTFVEAKHGVVFPTAENAAAQGSAAFFAALQQIQAYAQPVDKIEAEPEPLPLPISGDSNAQMQQPPDEDNAAEEADQWPVIEAYYSSTFNMTYCSLCKIHLHSNGFAVLHYNGQMHRAAEEKMSQEHKQWNEKLAKELEEWKAKPARAKMPMLFVPHSDHPAQPGPGPAPTTSLSGAPLVRQLEQIVVQMMMVDVVYSAIAGIWMHWTVILLFALYPHIMFV